MMSMDWNDLFVGLKILNFFIFSAPDIIGDTSYEELRAAAYDDAKRGLSLQSIVRKSDTHI